jgi:hypothetical protein
MDRAISQYKTPPENKNEETGHDSTWQTYLLENKRHISKHGKESSFSNWNANEINEKC